MPLSPGGRPCYYTDRKYLPVERRWRVDGSQQKASIAAAANEAEELLSQGQVLIAQEQRADAVAVLQRAVELAPGDWRCWAQLGLAYLDGDTQAKRSGKAVAAFERALALETETAWVWVKYASALIYVRRLQEALKACERALQLDPLSAPAYLDIGIASRMLGKLDESHAALERSLALDPTYYKAWINLAVTLIRQGEFPQALEASQRAREIDPAAARPRSLAAYALYMLKRPTEALIAANEALELAPDRGVALTVKLGVLAQERRYHEAIPVAERLTDLRPNDVSRWQTLGKLLIEAGKTSDAEAAFRKARQLEKARRRERRQSGWTARLGTWLLWWLRYALVLGGIGFTIAYLGFRQGDRTFAIAAAIVTVFLLCVIAVARGRELSRVARVRDAKGIEAFLEE